MGEYVVEAAFADGIVYFMRDSTPYIRDPNGVLREARQADYHPMMTQGSSVSPLHAPGFVLGSAEEAEIYGRAVQTYGSLGLLAWTLRDKTLSTSVRERSQGAIPDIQRMLQLSRPILERLPQFKSIEPYLVMSVDDLVADESFKPF